MKYELSLCCLYPDLMNLYGDRGNAIAILKRCEWLGVRTSIANVSIGEDFKEGKYDIVLIGGGQDREQRLVRKDFVLSKGDAVRDYIEQGGVLLAICGGYQMLGHYYRTAEGERLDFLGALDLITLAGNGRLIGDLIFRCEALPSRSGTLVVGFENHSGRTYLGSGLEPLGRVQRGHGNNGKDGTEGAIYKNTIGSYGHGSLLPKNPALTDLLIARALGRKYGQKIQLRQLDDSLSCRRAEPSSREGNKYYQ